MTFCFSKDARRDLARSLERTGASKNVNEAVAEIEGLTQRYYARFIARDDLPEMTFVGEATHLLDHANTVCNAIEFASRRTRRRLEDERVDREEDMSLPEYAQSVNDVCMFAIHAMGIGDRPIKKQRKTKANRALRRLTREVVGIWRKWTNSDLPKVPDSHGPTSWRTIRALQRNPIWIVYDALGIYLNAEDTGRLAAEFGAPESGESGRVGKSWSATSISSSCA